MAIPVKFYIEYNRGTVMTNSMNDYSRERLEQAGWHAGRKIVLNETEGELSRLGYKLQPNVRTFLQEFGDLSVQTLPPLVQPLFNTYAVEAAREINVEDVAACGSQVAAAVCPVGSIGYGSFFLVMDEHGRVFAITMFGELFFVADSTVALIDGLCCGGTVFQPLGLYLSQTDPSNDTPTAQSSKLDSSVDEQNTLPVNVVQKLMELGWQASELYPFDQKGLARIGVEVTPRMAAFLETYGGIRQEGFSPWASSSVVFWIWGNASQTNARHMEELRELVGARVCPIGTYSYENEFLFMDERGRFYSENTYSSEVKILADSEHDFIAGLVGCGFWEHWPFDPDEDRWTADNESTRN